MAYEKAPPLTNKHFSFHDKHSADSIKVDNNSNNNNTNNDDDDDDDDVAPFNNGTVKSQSLLSLNNCNKE